MLVTEKEATKRWCPAIRFVIGQDSSQWQGRAYTNRADDFGPAATTCVGSQCMWWRWGNGESDVWKKPDGTYHYGHSVDSHAVGKKGEASEGWRMAGYCGAAGKP